MSYTSTLPQVFPCCVERANVSVRNRLYKDKPIQEVRWQV